MRWLVRVSILSILYAADGDLEGFELQSLAGELISEGGGIELIGDEEIEGAFGFEIVGDAKAELD